MNNRKINTVIFDADNTLIDLDLAVKDALEYIFNNLGYELSEHHLNRFSIIDYTLWKDSRTKGSLINIKDVPTLRFEMLFKEFNFMYSDFNQVNEWFKEALAKASYPLNNSYEVIKRLYEDNYTICIITNGLIKLQEPRIMNTNFAKYIKRILVSEEVKITKPDPKIFNYLLEELGINSSEAIMIGDSLFNDVNGAQESNIKAIWFNPNLHINNSDILPNYEITSLLEVIDILQDLNK